MKVNFVDLGAQYESIKDEIAPQVKKVFKSGGFILSDEVKLFEEKFAKYCNVKYAVGVNSGTDAIYLALLSLGIGRGDEVIIPAHTYIATALAVSFTGAKPVLVDIDAVTYNIDIDKIKSAITKETKAIIPVHLYGQPVDMKPILKLAKKYSLKVVEDSAQAHGAVYRPTRITSDKKTRIAADKGKKVGSIGDAGCFSFYPTKNLGAFGDGGIVVTDKKSVYEKLLLLRDYGRRSKYMHVIKGHNSRLDSIQAVILKIKLKYLDKWNKQRQKNARYYSKLLKTVSDKVIIPKEVDCGTHVYHMYVVRIKNRDKVMEGLGNKGISTLIHYPIPIHLQKAYQDLGYRKGDFPITEEISHEILSLPLYPEMNFKQIEYVVDNLKKFI